VRNISLLVAIGINGSYYQKRICKGAKRAACSMDPETTPVVVMKQGFSEFRTGQPSVLRAEDPDE
jgi:hypothetical protein